LWNTNSTNQTINVSTTGNYWVRVTNASGCQKADTILVTVNPTPVVNLGNDTNLCQGVNLVLNSGNPGATRLWDNGTTGQTRTVNSTGTYYVRVTNAFNCSGRDTIVTTFFPTPSVNLGPDVDACEGSTVTLDAGNPGESFLWDNNTTQQTRVVSATGTYYVRVSNTANCRGRDTVVVTFHPLPVVNLGNDTAFCYGNVLTLNAGNPGASYLWNTNSTNQTINVSTTGNYNVVVTDMYNCVGSDNINILVKDPPSGTINAVYGNAATYAFNLLNTQYVTGVTWNFGDGSPTVGGYMVQHTYANNGIYTVTANLQGECADSLVNARTVDVFDAAGGNTGINQIDNKKELVMYPNPARDIVTIENKKDYKMQQITLYSVVGQQLSSSKADSPDKHKLNITGLASGIYTVRIETDKGIVIRKFEIAK
ncbi:MAG: T9SS type A sorting domain-containing protein, partial [Sphingobacteriales bacterium]